jgi:putative transposase
MLDVFGRYVVGWMVAHRESATLAEQFIHATCSRQGIDRDQLTIHADRGPAMTSKLVALLLADLGVTKTHARPHVQRQPVLGGAIQDAEVSVRIPNTLRLDPGRPAALSRLLPWYNTEHHHAGLGLLTPADVHHGLAEQRVAARATVLATAYATHPERFLAGLPHPPAPPVEVWINPPTISGLSQTSSATPPSPLAHTAAFA